MSNITDVTQNKISTLNYRAPSTLTEGSTWTGGWENVSQFNGLSVVVNTTSVDKIGWLYCDWSRDGTNVIQTYAFRIWDQELGKTITSSIKNAFVRLRFVCSTVQDTRNTPENNNMANLQIHCMFHMEPVKGDYEFGKQKKNLFGYHNMSGLNILSYGVSMTPSTYPLNTTGVNVRVQCGSNLNGDFMSGGIPGLYQREFIVVGLDTSYNEIYWRLSLLANNLGGIVTSPTAIWLRVNAIDCKVTKYGTAGTGDPTAGSWTGVFINDGSWKYVAQLHVDYDYRPSVAVYHLPNNYSYGKLTYFNVISNSAPNHRLHVNRRVPGTTTNLRMPELPLFVAARQEKTLIYPDGCTAVGMLEPGDMISVVGNSGGTVFISCESEVEVG